MKTIEEAAIEYTESKIKYEYDPAYFEDICKSFMKGADFAQRWISVDEELPRIGEKVITKMNKDKRTSYGIATRIREEWEIDAHWIDHTFSNMNITHWRHIDLK